MMPNLALTGVPRGGTTLACRLLGEADDALALFEPMPVERLSMDAAKAAGEVEDFFSDVRRQVLREGRAPSKHQAGVVPDNPYGDRRRGASRPRLVELGEITVNKPLGDEFHLVIKHNAAWLALLPELAGRMLVLGVVRHPLAVLASWHSVDLAVSHGHLPAGERLDADLAARLAAEPDVLERQLVILDWCFERLLRWVPAARLSRYEDIVADGGAGLIEAAGLTGMPATGLRNRNADAQCDRRMVPRLADALLRHGGPALTLYEPCTVERLADSMLAGAGDDGR